MIVPEEKSIVCSNVSWYNTLFTIKRRNVEVELQKFSRIRW